MSKKVKFFWQVQDTDIQDWLNANPNIEIISTNLTNSNCGWTYSILYQSITSNIVNETVISTLDRIADKSESMNTHISGMNTSTSGINVSMDRIADYLEDTQLITVSIPSTSVL